MITGAGLVTAAGDTPGHLHSAFVAGAPLAAPRPDTDYPVAAIENFDAHGYLPRKGVKDLSRLSQLSCAAASRIAPSIATLPGDRVGVVFGSAWGCLHTIVDFEREAHTQGPRFVDPILFTETVANVPAGQVAIFFGWSAFNATVSAGSASGLAAVSRALELLDEGRGLVALAGGGDELNPPLLRSLALRGELGAAGSLPLSKDRSGPVSGEGSCFLSLESNDHARSRGAIPLALVRGFASRFFPVAGAAEHAVSESIAETMREVLDAAALEPRRIDLLVLSAGGRVREDALEAAAALRVFGIGPEAPVVSIPKGILGETWGASGPLAVVSALEAMRSGEVPGTPHGLVADPGFVGLNLPPSSLRRMVRTALVIDVSTTGHHIAILLEAPGEETDAD